VHEGADRSGKVIIKHYRFTARRLAGALSPAQVRRRFRRQRPDVILSGGQCILAGPVTVYRSLVQIELDRPTAIGHGSALFPMTRLTYLVAGSRFPWPTLPRSYCRGRYMPRQ
jgi:hypothetical protein